MNDNAGSGEMESAGFIKASSRRTQTAEVDATAGWNESSEMLGGVHHLRARKW